MSTASNIDTLREQLATGGLHQFELDTILHIAYSHLHADSPDLGVPQTFGAETDEARARVAISAALATAQYLALARRISLAPSDEMLQQLIDAEKAQEQAAAEGAQSTE